MVETSVAVATPPPTALRIKKGKTKAGPAINKAFQIILKVERLTLSICSWRAFQRAKATKANNNTPAITTPL